MRSRSYGARLSIRAGQRRRPGAAALAAALAAWHLALAVAAAAAAQGPEGAAGKAGPGAAFTPESFQAASVILMDADTGTVLFAKEPHQRRPPASVLKMMVALVVLEQVQAGNRKLDEQVPTSRRAAAMGGSQVYLKQGEVFSLEDMLKAVVIGSANDAAVAVAEHVSGTVEGFADLMNAKARALGMRDSQFRNPHGLDAPDHYSTAYDLALLTRYALQSPTFAELVRARQVTITLQSPGKTRNRRPVVARRVVRSHNRLLAAFEGADGVKTGFTSEAGRCLVASAQRGDRRLIAVLLNDPRRWDDAASLLEYGFTRLGAPAATRASAPGGLAPPPRFAPEDPQVGG